MSHMRVSNSDEKAFQLAFLKLKRRRKGVGVGVTAALIRMAIGRCWACGIGSSTALLLSDAMLLLTKERSGLYPRFQRPLLNEQGSFGSCIKLRWCASDHSSTRSPFSSVLLYPQVVLQPHHSTEMLIFLLKDIFRDYIANGSSMYVTMLDASKAFDRVNHSKLFCKLIDRGCPAFIVRILYYWYSTQKFTIIWCQGLSNLFTVCNGVTQGGILSPHLFNVYMDDLSVIL